MPQVSERRRKPRRKPVEKPEAEWVTLEGVPGAPGSVRARLLDISELNIGVETPVAVFKNSVITVKGDASKGIPHGNVRARVVRCSALAEGGYRVGLEFEGGKPVQAVADYYEVLQVSEKADPETVHRVFRLLAQRYHPDNKTTGNAQVFRGIVEAYKVLSDPEKRAAYDIHLQSYRRFRWRIFDQREAAVGKAAEKAKRRGLLELLYTARLNQPGQPALTLHELEDLLGCPREHLEFSLWYLKENGWIARTDNGRYSITARGVEQAEAEDVLTTTGGGDVKPHLLSSGR